MDALMVSQVAPTRCSLNVDGNDRKLADLHGSQLRVAGAKQRLGLIVLSPISQDLRAPAQQDPSEPSPILVVAIDHHSNRRVLGDIRQTLEPGSGLAFGLAIDGDVEPFAADGKAYRHDMGDCAAIGGGEMRDTHFS